MERVKVHDLYDSAWDAFWSGSASTYATNTYLYKFYDTDNVFGQNGGEVDLNLRRVYGLE